MRVPEQPPDIWEILKDRAEEIFRVHQTPEYSDLLRSLNRSYRHWNKVRYIARAHGLAPEFLWVHLKMGRISQYRQTPFKGANGTPIRYTVPDEVSRELMLLDQETAGRMATDSDVRMPSGGQRERFVIRALTEEAIASSLLEGAATTRQEAKKMIRSGRLPQTTGERMVMNNYKTILFIRENSTTPMSPEFLLELQAMLTEDTLDEPDQVGRFRTSSDTVRVAGRDEETIYTPPSASELPDRLKVICDFANNPTADLHFIHPVIRATLLHFQIGVDHPFCDGNGRTARAVFYWYLLRHKYWLFEFMPISTLIRESPSKYALSFLYSETDEYDATYFLMYNADIFRRAREAMNEYIHRKLEEQRKAVNILNADTDLNLRQRQVLLGFSRDPDRHTTLETHAHEFQISYQTARTDMLDLVDRGYLSSFKDGKTYVFSRGRRLVEVETVE